MDNSNEQSRQTFLEEMAELFSELETALLELEQDPDDGSLIGQVFRTMHTIKGNSGMFGYRGVSSYIHELETVYDQVRNGTLPASRELVDLTLKAVDYVKEQLAGADPERFSDEERGRGLVSLLQRLVPAGTAACKEPPVHACSTTVSRFLPTLTAYETDRLRANLRRGRRVYCSRVAVPLTLLEQEVHAVADRLRGEGELLSKLPQMEGVAEGSIGLLLLFASSQQPDLLEKIVGAPAEEVDCRELAAFNTVNSRTDGEPVGQEGKGKQGGLDDSPPYRHDLPEAAAVPEIPPQLPSGPPAAESDAPLPAKHGSAPAERPQPHGIDAGRKAEEESNCVQVPAERLDRLVDIVGEQVTVQARLRQLAVASGDAELEALAERMERLSAELRDIVLNIRPAVATTITARIPLNQAIVEGLLVQAGECRFVILLNIVDECVELTGLHQEDADVLPMAGVRGRMVPYVRLREAFSLTGNPPDVQQMVITETERGRVGLVVDRVIGEHQAMIKSLGRMFHGIHGISGATILGDGAVAMVLDVPELVRAAQDKTAVRN